MKVERESKLAEEWEEGVRKVNELNELAEVKTLNDTIREIKDLYDDVFDMTMSSDKKELFFRTPKKKIRGCVVQSGSWSWCRGIVIGKDIGRQTEHSHQADYDVDMKWKLKAIEEHGKRIANELSSYQNKNTLMLKLYRILNNHEVKTKLNKVIKIEKNCKLTVLTKSGEKKTVGIDRFLVNLHKGSGIHTVMGKKGDKVHFEVNFPVDSNERNFHKATRVIQLYPELKDVIEKAKERYKSEVECMEKVRKEMFDGFRDVLVKRSV